MLIVDAPQSDKATVAMNANNFGFLIPDFLI